AAVTEKALPASVAAIQLPELGSWTPTVPTLLTAPALSGPERDATGTDPDGSHAGHSGGRDKRDASRHTRLDPERDAVTLAELAAVAGVPSPVPAVPLTDAQIGVVLRHLRYADDPPTSYRKARDDYRGAGFIGSEERIRHVWNSVVAAEDGDDASEDADGNEDEDADADA
ncbi:hypothetical protein AB0D72_34745, partial [Streptomyces sp. NPDC048188]